MVSNQRKRLPVDPAWRLRQRYWRTHVPQPGFYRTRLVRGGPWLPALIWAPCPFNWEDHHPPEDAGVATERRSHGLQVWTLYAHLNGRPVDPVEVWPRLDRITAREYHRMILAKARAQEYAPWEPEANPRHAVDLRRQPSLF